MSKRMTMKEPVEKKATKTMAALAFAGFMAFNSCVPSAMPSYQIQRYPNLNEKTFVVKNEVSESSFIEMLKERGATNIICSKGYISGTVVSALTADFMDYIYLFRDGTYIGRLKIRHDEGKPQVQPFVKIVYAKGTFGVFLVADNMEFKGKRIAQLILLKSRGKLDYIHIHLDKFIKEYGGVYDPYIGGENLETGIFFAARNNAGKPWPYAYKIILNGGRKAYPRKDT